MNVKSEGVGTDNKQVIELKKCPYCHTNQYTDNRNCSYCGKYLYVRVCPYCNNIIPAREDPCRYCGHLKPAEVTEESDLSIRAVKFQYKYLVILFLVSGVAMILWPESNPLPDYACSLHNPDDCMLPFLIWGRSGGVFLLILASMFIGWNAILRFREKKS